MNRIVSAALLCSALALSSCAVLTGSQSIAMADNYAKKKQYNDAVATYRAILHEHPDSIYASDARYGLAMALVSSDNPQKDYAQALREFEAFSKLYPNDSRITEVHNWISILKIIEDLKRLDIRHEERRRK